MNRKGFARSIWVFFSSLRLTIISLILLALISISGTILKQSQPLSFYVAEFGERWGSLIIKTGLSDIYHSFWFQGMLVLLLLNIIVCTIERFPPKWRSTLEVRDDIEPRFIGNLSNNAAVYTLKNRNDATSLVVDLLKRKRYKVVERKRKKRHVIFANKGRIGRFGSDIVHLSLFIIIAGVLSGSIWGYRDFIIVNSGTSAEVPKEENLKMRLDRFWIDYYKTGQIKQFNSVLTLHNGSGVIFKQQHIWVNNPMYYGGLVYYQSSYGYAWDKIEQARLVVKKNKGSTKDVSFMVEWKKTKEVPETNLSIRLVRYVADFAFDRDKKEVFSKSSEPDNPAVQIEVFDNGRVISRQWLFLNYPGLFSEIKDSGYSIYFVEYKPIRYSGISINKDPGSNIVWTGAVVMVIGCLLAFFIYHKRIWVILLERDGGTEIMLAGMVNKNRLGFSKEFSEMVASLRRKASEEEGK